LEKEKEGKRMAIFYFNYPKAENWETGNFTKLSKKERDPYSLLSSSDNI